MSLKLLDDSFFQSLYECSSVLHDQLPHEARDAQSAISNAQIQPYSTPQEALGVVNALAESILDKAPMAFELLMPLFVEKKEALSQPSPENNHPSSLPNENEESSTGVKKRPYDERTVTASTEETHTSTSTTSDASSSQPPQKIQRTAASQPSIHSLSNVVALLESSDDYVQALEQLNTLIPGFSLPNDSVESNTASSHEGIQGALAQRKQQLATALKTHTASFPRLFRNEAQEIISLKSDLWRLTDKQRVQMGLTAPHPDVPFLLDLHPSQAPSHWPQRTTPLGSIPAYLYLFPHAMDSEEDNNCRCVNNEYCYNVRDPWTTTMKYAERLLVEKDLASQSPSQLLDLLKGLHNEIADSSEFRNQELIVFDPTVQTRSFSAFAEKCRLSEPEMSKSFVELEQLARRWGSIEESTPYYNARHWAGLQRLGFLATEPKKLPTAATTFCEQLSTNLHNPHLHPYQVAAFIHYGITKIHPYGDGNGRLARLFTNIYLMQQGLPPFIVLEDAEYTKVVTAKDADFEHKFGEYLETTSHSIAQRLEMCYLPSEKHEWSWENVAGCPMQ